jgi:hypothetical protein
MSTRKGKNDTKIYKVGLGALLLILALVGVAYYMYVDSASSSSSSNSYDLVVNTDEATVDAILNEDGEIITPTNGASDSESYKFKLSNGDEINVAASDIDITKQGILYIVCPVFDENTKIFVDEKSVSEVPYLGIYDMGTHEIKVTYAGTQIKDIAANVVAGEVQQVTISFDKEAVANLIPTTGSTGSTSGTSTSSETSSSVNTDTSSGEPDLYQVTINVKQDNSLVYYNGFQKGYAPQVIYMEKGELGALDITNSLYTGVYQKSVKYNEGSITIDLDSVSGVTKINDASIVGDGTKIEDVTTTDPTSDDAILDDEESLSNPDEFDNDEVTITFQSNVKGTTVSYYDIYSNSVTSKIGSTSSSNPSTLAKKFTILSNKVWYVQFSANGYDSKVVTFSPWQDQTIPVTLVKAGSTTQSGYYDRVFEIRSLIADANGNNLVSEKGTITLSSSTPMYYKPSGSSEYKEAKSITLNYDAGKTILGQIQTKAGSQVNYVVEGSGIVRNTGSISISETSQSVAKIYVIPDLVYFKLNSYRMTSGSQSWVYNRIGEVRASDTKLMYLADILATVTSAANTDGANVYIQVKGDSYTGKRILLNTYSFSKIDPQLSSKSTSITINDNMKSDYIYTLVVYPKQPVSSATYSSAEISVYQIDLSGGKIVTTEVMKPQMVSLTDLTQYGADLPTLASKYGFNM